jgi:hypothetical protein
MKMYYVSTVLWNNEPIGFRGRVCFSNPAHPQLESAAGMWVGLVVRGHTGMLYELGWQCPSWGLQRTNGFDTKLPSKPGHWAHLQCTEPP